MKSHLLLAILYTCFATFLSAQNTPKLKAETIIEQVKTAYADLPYYVDTTVILNRVQDKVYGGESFSTFFSRPGYFEIAGEQSFKHRRATMKAGFYYEKNQELSVSWIQRGFHPYESGVYDLNEGLSRLIGIGGSAARSIASLLLPDSIRVGHGFNDFSRAYRQADDLIDGDTCYVLDLYFSADTMAAVNPVLDLIPAIPMSVSTKQYRYWIRQSDFMILKYDFESTRNERAHAMTVRIFPQPEQAVKLKPRPFLYGKMD